MNKFNAVFENQRQLNQVSTISNQYGNFPYCENDLIEILSEDVDEEIR